MNRYIAELVGTFVLVFASCGTAVLAGDKVGFLGVSLAFGLSLLAMVYAIGPISGCHINPAVTVGILISKKMDARYAGGYIVAQILGAILGRPCCCSSSRARRAVTTRRWRVSPPTVMASTLRAATA